MTKAKSILASLSSAFIFSSLVGFAPAAHADYDPEKYVKMADELKFTPEQREKLKKIQDDYHQTLPGKHKVMEEANEALEQALRGSATEADVRKKFAELAKKQDEFSEARFEKILAIRAILTNEQRLKFNAFKNGPNRTAEKVK